MFYRVAINSSETRNDESSVGRKSVEKNNDSVKYIGVPVAVFCDITVSTKSTIVSCTFFVNGYFFIDDECFVPYLARVSFYTSSRKHAIRQATRI